MGKNRLPASPARQDMFVYHYKSANLVAAALLLLLLVTAVRATAETAAADSSLSAAFCWVTESIWLIPWVT